MNFGDILDEWEKRTAKTNQKRSSSYEDTERSDSRSSANQGDKGVCTAEIDPLTAWLRTNPTYNKDEDRDTYSNGSQFAERRRRLRAKNPDASIDLHGLTRDEAWQQLSSFFDEAKRQHFEKVRIVHGKGNHSAGEAVLKPVTQEFIEHHPLAGESGNADSKSGGSGATWVILKNVQESSSQNWKE